MYTSFNQCSVALFADVYGCPYLSVLQPIPSAQQHQRSTNAIAGAEQPPSTNSGFRKDDNHHRDIRNASTCTIDCTARQQRITVLKRRPTPQPEFSSL